MRFVRAALAISAALTLCVAIGVPAAGAAERQESLAAAASTDAKDRPVARAACPPCVFGAVTVIRAAVAVRAATATRAIVAAGTVTRAAATRVAARVSRTTVRRVQRQARRISRRGEAWIRRNWSRFGPNTKSCLATVAFMEAHGYLRDRVLTRREWSNYAVFGPRLVSPVETLSINFPIRFSAEELATRATDEAIECAVGLGFTRYFGNR